MLLQERAQATGQRCYWGFPSATWAACWPQCFADIPVMSQLDGISQKELETQRWHPLRLKIHKGLQENKGRKRISKLKKKKGQTSMWVFGKQECSPHTHKMRALEFKYTIRKELKCKRALKFPMCCVNARNGFQLFQSHQDECC